jgi:hypothetical protein
MIDFIGKSHSFCDGISRRNMLRVGGLLAGGLPLTHLLGRENAPVQKPRKAVIQIWLAGGPSQLPVVSGPCFIVLPT